ncbi:MAG: sensor histidine kinase [Chloroflexi bacterium]|nr:sensor histidine kinase [Chloroflexota bacterium]
MSHPKVEPTAGVIGHALRPATPVRQYLGAPPHAPGTHRQRALRRNDDGVSTARAAVLEERARIARDLHDTVSQTLYAIALGASRARRLADQSDVQRVLDDLLRLTEAAQSEVRGLLTDMREGALVPRGLTAALTVLAADFRKRHQLDIRLSVANDPDLPAVTQDALIGIVREALHNVAKHAAATRVDIVIQLHKNRVLLMITDDGLGFDTATARPGHFGLQSMRERASAIGGTLAVLSERGVGTQIRIGIVSK